MQTLILSNNTQIPIISCIGGSEYYQGAQRAVLDFRISPDNYTLAEIDALFNADNCSSVTLKEITELQQQAVNEDGTLAVDENSDPVMETVEQVNEYIHQGYIMRVALSKQVYTVAGDDGVTDQEQISVRMAQQSAAEKQLAELAAQMTDAQLALCDVYELITGGNG